MTEDGFLRFVLDCVVRPRQAARSALAIDKTWTVVILASLVLALSVAISSWIRLRGELDPEMFVFTGPGNAALEAVIDFVMNFVVSLVAFPITLFVWNRVLGFHAQHTGVLAATIASFGLVFLSAPIFEAFGVVLWAAGSTAADWLPFAAQAVVSIGLSVFYYAETLSISVGSSLLRNLVATLVISVIIGIPLVAITAIPILAESDVSGPTEPVQ